MSYDHRMAATEWAETYLSKRARKFLAASLREYRREVPGTEQDLSQDIEFMVKIDSMLQNMDGWDIDQFVKAL